MLSANTVAVTDPDEAKAILKIMHELDDNDDVQDVYANFDISESLMQEVG
jgi:transcriptional/translational regulatory protein YebC/TACO1